MELKLKRIAPRDTYTIGRLFVDGARFCDTLEDKDRGLRKDMYDYEIQARKVYGETAIPKGRYLIDMDTVSQKYAAVPWYQSLCGGKMPRVLNVPGFTGILIHPGNTALDTFGCILVGENKVKGKVLNSRDTFARLYRVLAASRARGEHIWLTIE